MTLQRTDIAICGGSYAGMAAALALAHSCGPELAITLIDRRATGTTAGSDPRASALSAASVNLLTHLGVWQLLQHSSEPVLTIELTDSSLADSIRPVILTYDNVLQSGSGASVPATWIVPNAALDAALSAAIRKQPGIRFRQASVASCDAGQAHAVLNLDTGAPLAASVVIAADGRASRLRTAAGIGTVRTDPGQTGIVVTVEHSAHHRSTATQHFLPGGPFAVLPLPGGHTSCITWSETAASAADILVGPPAALLAAIEMRLAGHRGDVSVPGRPQSWTLESQLARQYVGPRLALIGDAAHSVHPIAGQGLNLAFRDVAALAECVSQAIRAGADPGAAGVLDQYEQQRRFDSAAAATAFAGMNRLFALDVSLLRAGRHAGLALVDRLPALKRHLINEAAGGSGTVPPLLLPPAKTNAQKP